MPGPRRTIPTLYKIPMFEGMYGLIASCVAGSTKAGLTLSAWNVSGCWADISPRSASISPLTLANN